MDDKQTFTPSLGKSAEAKTTVTEHNTANAVGSGLAPVFSTPMMIALMEEAACNVLSDLLADGQSSVGTYIETSHLSASPLGLEITATATIIAAEGRSVEFEVSAKDSFGTIGKGKHKRAIIDMERFLAKALEKQAKEG